MTDILHSLGPSRVTSLIVLITTVAVSSGSAFASSPRPLAPWNETRTGNRLQSWFEEASVEPALRTAVWQHFNSPQLHHDIARISATPLLDRLVEALCRSHEPTKTFWGKLIRDEFESEELDFLKDSQLGLFYQTNLSVAASRTLLNAGRFDDANQLLKIASAEECVDPALCLFLKAASARALFKLDEAHEAASRLLDDVEGPANRYRALAELIQLEIKKLEKEPLHEVAALMSDSERRLDRGRAGAPVQTVQDEIVKKLDKLIEQMEDESRKQSSASAGNSANPAGGSIEGADESRVKGAPGEGVVDPKKFSKAGSWGNMPEKEQTKARNLINRSYPAHYGDAIEKYSRKLANRTGTNPNP